VKLVAALALIAALHACDRPPPAEGPVPQDYTEQQRRCEAQGGRWGQGGKDGFYVCYRRTRDGGQSCSRGTDCQGLCLSRSRTCAPVTPLFGCQDILQDNGDRGRICVD
jgi:hypothetical protein